MRCNGVSIIKLSDGDDYGVYVTGARGPFGTSLVTRKTWAGIEEWRDLLVGELDGEYPEALPKPPRSS